MKYVHSKDSELIAEYLENFVYDKSRTEEVLRKYENLVHEKQYINKSRAIIIDDGKLLVCKYADLFLLPGGKKEEGETYIEALQRELLEEFGMIIDSNIEESFQYENEYSSYFDRKTNKNVNRHNTTKYYIVEKSNIIGYTERKLSDSKEDNGFMSFYISLDDLTKLIETYNSSNKKYEYFKYELLDVISFLKKTKKLTLKGEV